MPTEAAPLTPALVWREMSPDQRLTAAQAFWADADSVPQQVEAIQAIAHQLHFRPQSVLKLSEERRARQLAAQHKLAESVASRILVVYHLATQRPMLEAFLNSLGVAHENGLIAETASQPPEAGRLREAASALMTQFPPADVRVYMRTLAAQDPETWGGLTAVLSESTAS